MTGNATQSTCRGMAPLLWVEILVVFAAFATLPLNGVMALKRLLLLVLVLLAARRGWQIRTIPDIPAAIWAWFALAPMSIVWSVSPGFTRSELLADALYPALALLAAWTLCREERNYRAAETGLLAGLALTLAIGFADAVRTGSLATADWYRIAHGIGQFTTLLAMMLPLVLVFCIGKLAQRQWLVLASGLLLIAAVCVGAYAMPNRMFWLSSLASSFVVLLAAMMHPELSRVRLQLLGAFALFGTVLIGAFYAVARTKPASYLNAAPNADNSVTAAFTHNERFEMWQFWFDRISDKPLLGIGFGHDLPRLTYSSIKPEHWPDLMFAHAHNMLIDITVQLGLIGLTFFLAALAAIGFRLIRAARGGDLMTTLTAAAGIAMTLSMLTKNMTDDFFSRGPLFAFWIITGAILARTHKGTK